MESLGDEDGAGRGQVGLGGDVGGGAEVGRDTETLNDRGGRDEGLGGGETKVVGASLDGRGTGGGQAGLEVGDMSLLVVGNVLELVVEVGGEVGGGEVVNGPLGEGLLVEGVLEVLKLGKAVRGHVLIER